jgi:hypothetical protein
MKTIYFNDNNSLHSSASEKCFRRKCRENSNTHFIFNKSSPKFVPFIRQCAKGSTTQQAADCNIIRDMKVSYICWLNKATHTHTHTYLDFEMIFFLG